MRNHIWFMVNFSRAQDQIFRSIILFQIFRSHTSTYLNYTLMNANPSLENITENNEWTLMRYKPSRSEIKYENWVENDMFSEIRYKILIRRKPLFVLQNFVIPAVMLCILTLVSFFIPFAQGKFF